jgi:hypothetical protein
MLIFLGYLYFITRYVREVDLFCRYVSNSKQESEDVLSIWYSMVLVATCMPVEYYKVTD